MEEQNNRNDMGGNEQNMNDSAENMNYEYSQNYSTVPTVQKERVGLGIIGAFVGTLIGVIVIVLLGKFGYVASLSGVVMGFCALKGYQIMAKGFSTKGLVICVILMIIMVYISNWMTYALAVAEVYDADLLSSFAAVPMLLREQAIDAGYYYKDLIMLYLFTGLGAVPTIKDHFKK